MYFYFDYFILFYVLFLNFQDIIEHSRTSKEPHKDVVYNSLYKDTKKYTEEQHTLMAITAHIEQGFKKVHDQLQSKSSNTSKDKP